MQKSWEGCVSLFCLVEDLSLGSCLSTSSLQGISVNIEGAVDAWEGLGMHVKVLSSVRIRCGP